MSDKELMMSETVTGSQALAYGVLDAGVDYVTGYPGSPATSVVDALLDQGGEQVRVEWAVNEKSAFDAALGASLAGLRTLLCVKSVGLNVALDSLMVANLSGGDGGFVILVGDDPGSWGSQNEEDSRPLVVAAEIPLLEPTSLEDARPVIQYAFGLSEQFHLPVVVRTTRALAVRRAVCGPPLLTLPRFHQAGFRRQGERFNVLPIHVVALHQKLHATIDRVQALFEDSALNQTEGQGAVGVIAGGFMYDKVREVLRQAGEPPLALLGLGTLYPLPVRQIARYLGSMGAVLVLEETAPYLEVGVQAIAQRAGLDLPVYGRSSGHVPREGEIFAHEIGQALSALLPNWPWPALEPGGRIMPSRQPLCEGCPYIPLFESLLAVMERHGGRDAFVVTGEPSCMVRAQLPPFELLDVKYGMGASIGLAAGLARAGIEQKIVALSGDSALLHSGLGELIDAAQAGVNLTVVVLANETTALSGGQPHPGTAHDARGNPRRPVDLARLVQAAGADLSRVVDPEDRDATEAALEAALASDTLATVIAQRPCPKWQPSTALHEQT